MRVLMVSRTFTHPHDMGNRQRVYKECKKMKDMGWEVDFLYTGSHLQCDLKAMQEFFGEGHLFLAEWAGVELKYELKKEMRNRLDKCGITKYLALPYRADEWYSDNVEDGLQLLCKSKGCTIGTIHSVYDAIWVQYFFYSRFLELIPHNILKIIDIHDRFSYRNRMYQKDGKIPDFYYTVPREERKALSRADVAVSIQNREEIWFRNLLKGTDTTVVTMGDVVELHKSDFVDKKHYGFIGADNKPNELALAWFIDRVLPHIRKAEPDSVFVIAGGICKKIKDSNDYKKIGRVEELADFYNSICCAVNATRHGTGLNIKSIEALSYCKPMVSTAIGAKGLADAKEAMLVADKPKEFAEYVVRLLNDKQQCEKMCQAAEIFVKEYNRKNEAVLHEIEKMAKVQN